MSKSIRIASGGGFWGDLPRAPVDQVRKGPIDYLVIDYLAEVTMSILQKQKMRNPDHGYAKDFVDVMQEILPDVAQKGIKVIANAGGANPIACKNRIIEIKNDLGLSGLSVAVIGGDDILQNIPDLISRGYTLNNLDTGRSISKIRESLLSANVYLGCQPIVEALQLEADIIITGRVIDAGLIAAAMIYEFGWNFDDYDKLASGITAGHIIECGAQASGGNFTDWQEVDDLANIGFPIVEAFEAGDFEITKHTGTGGLINKKAIKEQLVYEIADPQNYLTPDVIADFTSISLSQSEKDRVHISGVEGKAPPESYKVSASYSSGFKLSSTLLYSWPEALRKAQKAGEILRDRARKLDLVFDKFRIDYIGMNGCSEQKVTDDLLEKEYSEIQMRVSVSGQNKEDINRFGKEIAPLVLTGPAGVTGYAGGRPKASQVVAYWPALIDKRAVKPQVQIFS